MLAIPPRLSVAWFPENQINIATSIAVSANNLGVAVGCALTPLMVKNESMATDIPRLLLTQFFMGLIVLALVWFSLQRPPSFIQSDTEDCSSAEQRKLLLKEKSFIFMLCAYGGVMGAQCAIVTLLAQILVPTFGSSMDIGFLGSMMLLSGVPASIGVGFYLDRTLRYRFVCNLLCIGVFASVLGLYLSVELRSTLGVVGCCFMFGVTSYGIAPAMFQYASELFYPVSEIIPTGYLYTAGNIQGLALVACMGWSENTAYSFSMRLPMLFLTSTMLLGAILMARVDGIMKRSAALSQ